MNYLLYILSIPLLLLIIWMVRKIYYRLTTEYLQFVLKTPGGKTVKTEPMDATQENIARIPDFLNDPESDGGYLTIHQDGQEALILPRRLLENCIIKTRIIRRMTK